MSTAPFLAPHREPRLALARFKTSGGTTYYNIPGIVFTGDSTAAQSSGVDQYQPWWTPSPIRISKLAFSVSTSHASNARVGFYAADRDWQPVGPPLADSGDISVSSTGIKTYTPGTPIFCPPGRYVSVSNCSGTPAFRAWFGWPAIHGFTLSTTSFTNRITYPRVTRSYAAFPTPGTKWTTTSDASGTYLDYWVAYEVTSL